MRHAVISCALYNIRHQEQNKQKDRQIIELGGTPVSETGSLAIQPAPRRNNSTKSPLSRPQSMGEPLMNVSALYLRFHSSSHCLGQAARIPDAPGNAVVVPNSSVLIKTWIPSAFLTGAGSKTHHIYQVRQAYFFMTVEMMGL